MLFLKFLIRKWVRDLNKGQSLSDSVPANCQRSMQKFFNWENVRAIEASVIKFLILKIFVPPP